MTVTLFKLSTGETVVGDLLSQEVIDERANTRVYQVRLPMVVNPRGLELTDWFPGCTYEIMPILVSSVMMMAEINLIDPVLVELYMMAIDPNDPLFW